MVRRTVIRMVLPLFVVACSTGPLASPSPAFPPSPQMPAAGAPPLVLTNATSMAVELLVNGAAMGEAAPNVPLSVAADQLPGYPWHVQAQTASGRTLASLDVPGDVQRTTLPDRSTQVMGYATTVNLSCGQIVLSYGPPPLGGPPTAASSASDDCAP